MYKQCKYRINSYLHYIFKNENPSIPSVQEQDLSDARLFHKLAISGRSLRQGRRLFIRPGSALCSDLKKRAAKLDELLDEYLKANGLGDEPGSFLQKEVKLAPGFRGLPEI